MDGNDSSDHWLTHLSIVLRKVLFVLVINLLVIEILLRVISAMYPFERPLHLGDSYLHQWLEGKDWLDGKTRLYIYKPNTVGRTHGHEFRVNRWGFRGEDFWERDRPEVKDVFRIMVLGDSVTSGIGIAEGDRYTNILEKRLQEHYPSRRIEVVNLGVDGFETLQEEKIMHRMWDVVRPNLTIVGFYVNDPNTTYDFYLPYKLPIPESTRQVVERLLTFRLLEPWYDPLYRKLRNIPSHEEIMWRAYDSNTDDWKLFVRSVENIARWVIEHTGKPPIVIYLLDVEELRKLGMYAGVRDVFAKSGFIWCEPDGNHYAPVSRFEDHPTKRRTGGTLMHCFGQLWGES